MFRRIIRRLRRFSVEEKPSSDPNENYRRKGVKIGKNVRIIGIIDGVNPHLITIGNNVVIGRHSALLTHCPIKGPQPVRVGNNVWIGFGAIVLPGVKIGDNCIVGGGSVVTNDIEPNSIVAGNPARVLRKRDPDELARTISLIESGKPIGKDYQRHYSYDEKE